MASDALGEFYGPLLASLGSIWVTEDAFVPDQNFPFVLFSLPKRACNRRRIKRSFVAISLLQKLPGVSNATRVHISRFRLPLRGCWLLLCTATSRGETKIL